MLTSNFFHGSILHIALNMLSLLSLGAFVEKKVGTISFFYKVLAYSIGHNVLAIGCYFILKMIPYFVPYARGCSIGFSGVLFGLVGLISYKDDYQQSESTSLFGIVAVSRRLYPWALLIFLQLLIPNVSLLGHLAGLIVGIMDAFNLFLYISPSAQTVSHLETKLPQSLKALPNYVVQPESGNSLSGYSLGNNASGDEENEGIVNRFKRYVLSIKRYVLSLYGQQAYEPVPTSTPPRTHVADNRV